MTKFVALLRGINVGGKNVIPMKALSACFTDAGYEDVRTYIQSGNVVFSSPGTAPRLVPAIERALRDAFSYDAAVVVKTHAELTRIVKEAPKGFGAAPDLYRFDVLFLMPSVKPAAALAQVPVKEGVDRAHAGPGVLYFSRLVEKATQSKLSRISALPLYQQLTIRNWNTTTRLLAMMDAP